MHPEQSSNGPHDHSAPQNPRNFQALSDLSLDDFEVDILHIARLFFVAFHLPQTCAWVNAFQCAENRFTAPLGSSLAKCVLDIVNVTRSLRRSGFEYCDSRCEGCRRFVTKEERYFMNVIHHIRRGELAKARMQSMLLCEGADDTELLNCVSRLAGHLCTPSVACH